MGGRLLSGVEELGMKLPIWPDIMGSEAVEEFRDCCAGDRRALKESMIERDLNPKLYSRCGYRCN